MSQAHTNESKPTPTTKQPPPHPLLRAFRSTPSLLLGAPFALASIPLVAQPLLSPTARSSLLQSSTYYLSAYVNYYRTGLSAAAPPFLKGYLSSLMSVVFIPLIEGARQGPTIEENTSMRLGVVSQLFGRAFTYPMWFGFFASAQLRSRTSDNEDEGEGTEISQYTAEGILLSLLAAYVLPLSQWTSPPTAKSSKWIIAWFLYPLMMPILQRSYLSLRTYASGPEKSTKETRQTAYRLTLATYALGFLHATVPHIKVVYPMLWKKQSLAPLLSPTYPLSSEMGSMNSKIFHTIQWDCILTFSSSLLATLTLARNMKELALIGLWDVVGVVLFGTGAPLSGVWAWREYKLRKARLREEYRLEKEMMRGEQVTIEK